MRTRTSMLPSVRRSPSTLSSRARISTSVRRIGVLWRRVRSSGEAAFDMKSANSVFAGLGTTIFSVMSQLARECGAINLGQGFPDTNGPADVRRHAATYLEDRPNQYPP